MNIIQMISQYSNPRFQHNLATIPFIRAQFCSSHPENNLVHSLGEPHTSMINVQFCLYSMHIRMSQLVWPAQKFFDRDRNMLIMETLRYNEDKVARGELSLVTCSNRMPLLPLRTPVVPIPSPSLNKYVLQRERMAAKNRNEELPHCVTYALLPCSRSPYHVLYIVITSCTCCDHHSFSYIYTVTLTQINSRELWRELWIKNQC